MKRFLVLVVALLIAIAVGTAWAADYPGGQKMSGTMTVQIDPNFNGVNARQVNATITDMPAITGQINATITDMPAITGQVNATITNNPVLGAGDNNIGNVDVVTLPSLPAGVNVIGSATMLGSAGKPIAQDSEGKVMVSSSADSGINLKKSYTFSNIASTDEWVSIGTYGVTSGKSLKISNVKATGLYAVEIKIGDGTTGDEIYLATSPASPSDNSVDNTPTAKEAGVTITVYAKTTESTNSGTISWSGYEY